MADESAFATAYYDEVRRSFRGYKRLADGGLAQLSDQEFFRAPNPESNSAAAVVKHVAGNLRSRWQDFLTSDGEKPDRNRDQEFIIEPGLTREELMRRWEASFKIVFDTIAAITPEEFSRMVTVRGAAHHPPRHEPQPDAHCLPRRADSLCGQAAARGGLENAEHSQGKIRRVQQNEAGRAQGPSTEPAGMSFV